jgi:tetratricopeptide (TPR) repeat protein
MAKEKQSEALVEKTNEATNTTAEKKTSLIEKLDASPKLVSIVLGVLVLAVAGFFGYRYMQNQQNDAALSEMFLAEKYFELDSTDLALNGTKAFKGLEAISDEYSGTKAGERAALMTGIIYLKKGKFEDAISYLKKYDGDDFLYKARAKALIGDAYMELNQFEDAANYYSKAADIYPNEQFTPRYLIKLGFALEAAKDYSSAAKAYERVTKEYPKSSDFQDARKYLARAQGLAAAE